MSYAMYIVDRGIIGDPIAPINLCVKPSEFASNFPTQAKSGRVDCGFYDRGTREEFFEPR